MNSTEYWKEVNDSAEIIVSEALELVADDDCNDSAEEVINDYLLHETIDSHEYIIYTANHLPVLQHSDNADYMLDNIGGADESLKQGLDTLHCHLAFYAFYADVSEYVYKALERQEAA